MKRLLLTLATCSLFAASPLHKEPPPPPAFDADLFHKDAQVFSGHVGFLYWMATEGGLEYGVNSAGNVQTPDFDMAPGFRLGFSYFRAAHYWEVQWWYTHMIADGHQDPSNIHLNYNIFDMLVTRVFIPNNHLRMRVAGGVFLGWMNQDWTVSNVTNNWDYVGGGLKAGTVVDWYWTWDLYMTAQAYFGTLIGGYNNYHDNVCLHDVRPALTVQMLLGPSWQKTFTKNRVEVFAGYETNLWYNVNETYSAARAQSTGALTFYGLTTRVTVDF